jgi:replicative DNA helicase Mcm
MVSGKALLRDYIKEYHKQDIEDAKSNKQQCRISIDYESLNDYLIEKSGKDFWQLQIYQHIDKLNEKFDADGYATLKFKNVPENCNLHDLDASYNNKWISCKAMIKNITDTRADIKVASYICRECGFNNLVHITDPKQGEVIPSRCNGPDCSADNKAMRLDKDTSIYRNYKLIKLEQPLELRTGGNTREFKALLLDFLASPHCNLKAGDVVNITGTFKVEPRKVKGRADGYEFFIHVHNITPVEDVFEDSRITDDDRSKILELSNRDDIFRILWKNLAPEVYGYDIVKQGLLLQLFEGPRPKEDVFKSDNMERWTIHSLLIGDPGIGKSQLIQALKKRTPKIIGTSGTNSSQAGLTVSSVKDELTGNWTMEAGAVILADTGVLCIDEYDKLSPSAQKSLNEPMEQLSVSSSKAGMVQTMTARTSIVAAANPKYSRFDRYKSFREQLDIPESNLSRFDLLFVLEDTIDENKDAELAEALLNKDYLIDDVEVIDIDLFKKYVTWIKANCFPVLNDDAKAMLVQFYVDTRQEAAHTEDGKPITARDLKALERLTIARAKCENRSIATVEDVLDVLEIYIASLNSIGLTPVTAGELSGIKSDKELDIINDIEELVLKKLRFDDGNLSAESMRMLEFECGVRCTNTSLDPKQVLKEALSKNAL